MTFPKHVVMGEHDLNTLSILNYKQKDHLHRPSLSPLSCQHTLGNPLIHFYYSHVDFYLFIYLFILSV